MVDTFQGGLDKGIVKLTNSLFIRVLTILRSAIKGLLYFFMILHILATSWIMLMPARFVQVDYSDAEYLFKIYLEGFYFTVITITSVGYR